MDTRFEFAADMVMKLLLQVTFGMTARMCWQPSSAAKLRRRARKYLFRPTEPHTAGERVMVVARGFSSKLLHVQQQGKPSFLRKRFYVPALDPDKCLDYLHPGAALELAKALWYGLYDNQDSDGAHSADGLQPKGLRMLCHVGASGKPMLCLEVDYPSIDGKEADLQAYMAMVTDCGEFGHVTMTSAVRKLVERNPDLSGWHSSYMRYIHNLDLVDEGQDTDILLPLHDAHSPHPALAQEDVSDAKAHVDQCSTVKLLPALEKASRAPLLCTYQPQAKQAETPKHAAQVVPAPTQPAAAPGKKPPCAPLIMAPVPKPARQQQQQALKKTQATASTAENESGAKAQFKDPSTTKSKKTLRQEAAEKELEAAQKKARAAADRALAGGLRSRRMSSTNTSSSTNTTSSTTTSSSKTSCVQRTALQVVEESDDDEELAHSTEVLRLVAAGQTSGPVSRCHLGASMPSSSAEGTEQGAGSNSSGSLSSGMNSPGASMESLMSSEEVSDQDHQDSRSHNSSSNGDSQAAEHQQAATRAQEEVVVLHSEETVVDPLSVLDGGMSSGNLSSDLDTELIASSGSLSGYSSMSGSSDSPTAAEPHYEAVSEALMSLSSEQLSEHLQGQDDNDGSYVISSRNLAVDQRQVASMSEPIHSSLIPLLPGANMQLWAPAPAQPLTEVAHEHVILLQPTAVDDTQAVMSFNAATDDSSKRHELAPESDAPPAHDEQQWEIMHPQQPATDIQYEQPADDLQPEQHAGSSQEQRSGDEPQRPAPAIPYEQPADEQPEQHEGGSQEQQAEDESAAAVQSRQQPQSHPLVWQSHPLEVHSHALDAHSYALVLESHPILVSDQQPRQGWVGRAAGFARRLLGGRKA